MLALCCAGFADKPIVLDSVRPLSRRQVEMLELLWQVASGFVSVKVAPFCLDTVQADLASRRMSYVGDAFSVRR